MPYDSTNYPQTAPEVESDSITEILIEARKILEEKGWFKGYFAKDSKDNFCDPTNPDAASFCSLGAISLAAYNKTKNANWEVEIFRGYAEASKRLDSSVPRSLYYDNVVQFNDSPHTNKEDVLALFDRAIAHHLDPNDPTR